MKNKLNDILKNLDNQKVENIGLISGESGISLFYYYSSLFVEKIIKN